jgi:hypothetical protein
MMKLEALENKELPKGWKEKKTSSTLERVIYSEGPDRDEEKEETSPKKQEQASEGESFEKNEDLGGLKKEEELSGIPPKIWEETWKGLVDFTRARNPILGSFLALGNLVHLSDEKIEIGFEKDSFHYERMLEKENRNLLESICHEYLQRKTEVVVSPLNLGMRSMGGMVFSKGEATRNELDKQLEKREEENPLIQEALRLFDGKIVEG